MNPLSGLAGLARRAVGVLALRPTLTGEVRLDIGGRDEIPAGRRPMIMVANHASRLDVPLVLAALPPQVRRSTTVSAAGDLVFGTGRGTDVLSAAVNAITDPGRALRDGWHVLLFGEGSRTTDGYLRAFGPEAARLALQHRVPVLPIGIRGSFAAMPEGQPRPVPGRPRVSVRFSSPLEARPGEAADALTGRITTAVRGLIAEDATTWWQSRRDPAASESGDEPPSGSWRRIWEQSQPPVPGGQPRRPRIWR